MLDPCCLCANKLWQVKYGHRYEETHRAKEQHSRVSPRRLSPIRDRSERIYSDSVASSVLHPRTYTATALTELTRRQKERERNMSNQKNSMFKPTRSEIISYTFPFSFILKSEGKYFVPTIRLTFPQRPGEQTSHLEAVLI